MWMFATRYVTFETYGNLGQALQEKLRALQPTLEDRMINMIK